jgi:pimeloyl-ACP methyl ester carboxylesterase
VTVVGHSAGGQFVQRYAGETRVQRKLAALRNSYRYIVSNPSSYMYLSAARYHPAKRAFGPLTAAEVRSCPRYNRYKHGLQALNLYGTVAGASGIRRQYASQSIVYLLGGADTDRNDPTLDHSCAAMWQGGQRLERGRLFHRSLIAIFGSSITRRHRLVVVPGVAHDARAMYTSAAGRAALFP